jgi:hypothetical protein
LLVFLKLEQKYDFKYIYAGDYSSSDIFPQLTQMRVPSVVWRVEARRMGRILGEGGAERLLDCVASRLIFTGDQWWDW